jgi:uncharacterized membrane protein YsdA (DUF1294 family)/cold shock CspA family protein
MAEQGFQRGKITKWNDDRGFGFIQNLEGGGNVFLHISALQDRHIRPRDGDIILFQATADSDGRVRAERAYMEKKRSQGASFVLEAYLWLFLLLMLPIIGSILLFLQFRNPIPLIVYLIMSIITYLMYVRDKLQAQKQLDRIPEATLHLLEFLGGWPGGFLAQQLWRHKSSKQSYQMVFWLIVGVHLLSWLGYLFLWWQGR